MSALVGINLFAGLGGLTEGAEQAGVTELVALLSEAAAEHGRGEVFAGTGAPWEQG